MFKLAIALFWPLLQLAPQSAPRVAPYVELSKRWDPAGVFETGLSRTAAVVVCPTVIEGAGSVIVADSAGQIVEMRFEPDGWTKVRTFAIGEPLTGVCAGAPHLDRIWRVYIGTKSGRVLELSRTSMGWSTNEVRTVVAPVTNIQASDPGPNGISQLFVIDGDGRTLNLWLTEADVWVTRLLPEIDGGATEVCFDIDKSGLTSILASPSGTIYKFRQDSTGNWGGGPWTTMPAGPLDMVSSADPTGRDIAVYYSGSDGVFRYLFYDYKEDEKARVGIADATTNLIGKGSQRRFNEFFGINGGNFYLFEFNFATREWDRIPIEGIPATVVSVVFGPGRGAAMHQIYVARIDGKIHEYVRQELKPE
jgi:hypothetical protein